ncbi:MAG: hypothetical protein HPY59_07240 [Anaerolineae bacterium]|nr:hypothetical protein [Anaerolineae bacterium]
MAFLTICTAPKPFTNPHIAMIQRNAIRSWRELGSEVDILLVGDEPGIQEAANELGVHCAPEVARNSQGTPMVSSMFELARQLGSPLVACVNADILLLPDFVRVARLAAGRFSEFLVVGQRWDLDVREPLDFSAGWQDRLRADLKKRGRLHPRGGSDYFIFPRHGYTGMPPLVIGRAGWDNWMIYEARRNGWAVVDASRSVTIVHQNHDYSHLAGGQPHYRHPETAENIRLGGGERTIFTLLDCNFEAVDAELRPPPFSWKKLWREMEVFPLVRMRSRALGWLFYAVFHPLRAYRSFRVWMHRRLKQRPDLTCD